MVRCGGEIENGDFNKGRTRMLDSFGMYLLLRYIAIGLLENFEERCQNSRFTANNKQLLDEVDQNIVIS